MRLKKATAMAIVKELLGDPNQSKGFDRFETDKLISVLSTATEMGHKVVV